MANDFPAIPTGYRGDEEGGPLPAPTPHPNQQQAGQQYHGGGGTIGVGGNPPPMPHPDQRGAGAAYHGGGGVPGVGGNPPPPPPPSDFPAIPTGPNPGQNPAGSPLPPPAPVYTPTRETTQAEKDAAIEAYYAAHPEELAALRASLQSQNDSASNWGVEPTVAADDAAAQEARFGVWSEAMDTYIAEVAEKEFPDFVDDAKAEELREALRSKAREEVAKQTGLVFDERTGLTLTVTERDRLHADMDSGKIVVENKKIKSAEQSVAEREVSNLQSAVDRNNAEIQRIQQEEYLPYVHNALREQGFTIDEATGQITAPAGYNLSQEDFDAGLRAIEQRFIAERLQPAYDNANEEIQRITATLRSLEHPGGWGIETPEPYASGFTPTKLVPKNEAEATILRRNPEMVELSDGSFVKPSQKEDYAIARQLQEIEAQMSYSLMDLALNTAFVLGAPVVGVAGGLVAGGAATTAAIGIGAATAAPGVFGFGANFVAQLPAAIAIDTAHSWATGNESLLSDLTVVLYGQTLDEMAEAGRLPQVVADFLDLASQPDILLDLGIGGTAARAAIRRAGLEPTSIAGRAVRNVGAGATGVAAFTSVEAGIGAALLASSQVNLPIIPQELQDTAAGLIGASLGSYGAIPVVRGIDKAKVIGEDALHAIETHVATQLARADGGLTPQTATALGLSPEVGEGASLDVALQTLKDRETMLLSDPRRTETDPEIILIRETMRGLEAISAAAGVTRLPGDLPAFDVNDNMLATRLQGYMVRNAESMGIAIQRPTDGSTMSFGQFVDAIDALGGREVVDPLADLHASARNYVENTENPTVRGWRKSLTPEQEAYIVDNGLDARTIYMERNQLVATRVQADIPPEAADTAAQILGPHAAEIPETVEVKAEPPRLKATKHPAGMLKAARDLLAVAQGVDPQPFGRGDAVTMQELKDALKALGRGFNMTDSRAQLIERLDYAVNRPTEIPESALRELKALEDLDSPYMSTWHPSDLAKQRKARAMRFNAEAKALGMTTAELRALVKPTETVNTKALLSKSIDDMTPAEAAALNKATAPLRSDPVNHNGAKAARAVNKRAFERINEVNGTKPPRANTSRTTLTVDGKTTVLENGRLLGDPSEGIDAAPKPVRVLDIYVPDGARVDFRDLEQVIEANKTVPLSLSERVRVLTSTAMSKVTGRDVTPIRGTEYAFAKHVNDVVDKIRAWVEVDIDNVAESLSAYGVRINSKGAMVDAKGKPMFGGAHWSEIAQNPTLRSQLTAREQKAFQVMEDAMREPITLIREAITKGDVTIPRGMKRGEYLDQVMKQFGMDKDGNWLPTLARDARGKPVRGEGSSISGYEANPAALIGKQKQEMLLWLSSETITHAARQSKDISVPATLNSKIAKINKDIQRNRKVLADADAQITRIRTASDDLATGKINQRQFDRTMADLVKRHPGLEGKSPEDALRILQDSRDWMNLRISESETAMSHLRDSASPDMRGSDKLPEFLRWYQTANNNMRQLNATFDLSFTGVQGTIGFYANTRGWAISMFSGLSHLAELPEAVDVGATVRGRRSENILGAPGRAADTFRFNQRQKRLNDIREAIAHGMFYAGRNNLNEFQFSSGLAKLPFLGKGFDISNSGFSSFGNGMRLQNYLTMKEIQKARVAAGKDPFTPGQWRQAMETNNRGTGYSSGKVSMLESLTVFAPRFLRAQFGFLGDALTQWNSGNEISGRFARNALAKTMAGGVTIVILGNLAAGQSWEEIEERLTDWDSPNFMRVRAFGRDISPFGSYDSLYKMFAIAASDGPLAALDYARISKASPMLSTLTSLIEGETAWAHKNVDIFGNPLEALTNLAQERLPFSVQGVFDDGFGPGTFIDVLGFKSSPMSAGERKAEGTDRLMRQTAPIVAEEFPNLSAEWAAAATKELVRNTDEYKSLDKAARDSFLGFQDEDVTKLWDAYYADLDAIERSRSDLMAGEDERINLLWTQKGSWWGVETEGDLSTQEQVTIWKREEQRLERELSEWRDSAQVNALYDEANSLVAQRRALIETVKGLRRQVGENDLAGQYSTARSGGGRTDEARKRVATAPNDAIREQIEALDAQIDGLSSIIDAKFDAIDAAAAEAEKQGDARAKQLSEIRDNLDKWEDTVWEYRDKKGDHNITIQARRHQVETSAAYADILAGRDESFEKRNQEAQQYTAEQRAAGKSDSEIAIEVQEKFNISVLDVVRSQWYDVYEQHTNPDTGLITNWDEVNRKHQLILSTLAPADREYFETIINDSQRRKSWADLEFAAAREAKAPTDGEFYGVDVRASKPERSLLGAAAVASGIRDKEFFGSQTMSTGLSLIAAQKQVDDLVNLATTNPNAATLHLAAIIAKSDADPYYTVNEFKGLVRTTLENQGVADKDINRIVGPITAGAVYRALDREEVPPPIEQVRQNLAAGNDVKNNVQTAVNNLPSVTPTSIGVGPKYPNEPLPGDTSPDVLTAFREILEEDFFGKVVDKQTGVQTQFTHAGLVPTRTATYQFLYDHNVDTTDEFRSTFKALVNENMNNPQVQRLLAADPMFREAFYTSDDAFITPAGREYIASIDKILRALDGEEVLSEEQAIAGMKQVIINRYLDTTGAGNLEGQFDALKDAKKAAQNDPRLKQISLALEDVKWRQDEAYALARAGRISNAERDAILANLEAERATYINQRAAVNADIEQKVAALVSQEQEVRGLLPLTLDDDLIRYLMEVGVNTDREISDAIANLYIRNKDDFRLRQLQEFAAGGEPTGALKAFMDRRVEDLVAAGVSQQEAQRMVRQGLTDVYRLEEGLTPTAGASPEPQMDPRAAARGNVPGQRDPFSSNIDPKLQQQRNDANIDDQELRVQWYIYQNEGMQGLNAYRKSRGMSPLSSPPRDPFARRTAADMGVREARRR